jgi:hypothetical protein
MLGEKFSVSTRKVFDTFEHGPFRMWELLVAVSIVTGVTFWILVAACWSEATFLYNRLYNRFNIHHEFPQIGVINRFGLLQIHGGRALKGMSGSTKPMIHNVQVVPRKCGCADRKRHPYVTDDNVPPADLNRRIATRAQICS